MKKSTIVSVAHVLVVGLGVIPSMVYASPAETTALFSVTSDYFWRGYSKSESHPSVQLNVDYSLASLGKGPYAGFWLSSIRPGEIDKTSEANIEFVAYGGWSLGAWHDFSSDIQLSYYVYDKTFVAGTSYPEMYWFLRYKDLTSLELAYTNDTYGTGEESINSQVNFMYPMTSRLDTSFGVGYFKAKQAFGEDYIYWNAGFTWRYSHFAVDLRYVGDKEKVLTNLINPSDRHDEDISHRLILTISLGI